MRPVKINPRKLEEKDKKLVPGVHTPLKEGFQHRAV